MAGKAGAAIDGLRVRVLGSFEIDGVDVGTVASRKGRQLLRLLALGRGVPVRVDHLVDALWGDAPPARPNDQLSVLVSRLRRELGSEAIARTDAGYALQVAWLDLTEFALLASDAEKRLASGSPVSARAAAGAALRLARGPLLADALDLPGVAEERFAVQRLMGRVTVVAAEAELDAGEPAAAALLAEQALDADPYDEAALRLLMRAHEQAGRPASALAAYARVRERLRDDLGVSPSAETEAAHDGLLLAPKAEPASPPVAAEAFELPPLPHAPLAGRAGALAQLDEQLRQAQHDGPRFVLVGGESGIGKSTLLDRWTVAVAGAGVPVLRGRCDEVSRQLPLQAVLDALDAYLANLEPSAANALLTTEAEALLPLLAHGRGSSSHAGSTREADAAVEVAALARGGSEQAVLFVALVAVVDRITAPCGGVLVIDDVHFAGESTSEWLRFVQRRSHERLLIVVASRPEGQPVLRPDVTIALGPLDLTAAVELVGEEARAVALLERSGGHPLLLVELAHGDEAGRPADEALPASILEATRDRLRQMGGAGVTIQTAAVLGDEIDLDLLAEVLRRSPIEVLDDVEQGVAHRFLDEVGASLVFRHTLVRDALVAGVSAPRRSFSHREAARALARRDRADPLEVARHARLGGEIELAATSLGEAAARATRRHDRAEAMRLLDDAIGLCDLASLRLQRGLEHLAIGEYAEASDDALAALDGGAEARALELLGWSRYYLHQFDAAQRAADDGARLADEPAVEASCLILAGRILQANGELRDADGRMTQAEALIEAARVPMVPVWIGSLRSQQGRNAEAVRLVDRGLLQPGAIDHPFAVIHGHLTLAHALAQLGHVDRALAALDAADREIDGRHVSARFAGRTGNWRAWIIRYLGAFGEADERNEDSFASAESLGLDEPQAHALLDRADGALLAGDLDRAASLLEQAAPYHERQHVMRWRHALRGQLLTARLAVEAGDWDLGEEQAAAVVALGEGYGAERYVVLGTLVEALARARRGDQIDPSHLQPTLDRLSDVAGGEAWWWQARFAHAIGIERWRDEAEARVASLLTRADPHRTALERFASATLGS